MGISGLLDEIVTRCILSGLVGIMLQNSIISLVSLHYAQFNSFYAYDFIILYL